MEETEPPSASVSGSGMGASVLRSNSASSSISITSSVLLEGLKDSSNSAVWQQYVDRYRPVILQYGLRLGLSPADAEDATQQALIEFCRSYQAGKYDRQRGRLRDWLFGIVRNQVLNLRRRQAARGEVQIAGSGTDFFERIMDEDRWPAVWENEWRSAVMQQCLTEVRAEVQPQTFRAFELFAIEGLPAERVAADLNISANAVFLAKRRILRRVRELMPEVDATW